MSERSKHLFEFQASDISAAARAEAEYHAARLAYWQSELDTATTTVEKTAGVKVKRVEVTGGWRPEVVIDHGDQAAYIRMIEAGTKIHQHTTARDRFLTDAELYGTQDARPYMLDGDDVAHFRLNGRPREL